MSDPTPYTKATVVFPMRGDQVLLGLKERSLGRGWRNGFGGKLEPGEDTGKASDYEASALRETLEEVKGIQIAGLINIANLHFYFDREMGMVVRAYKCRFTGEPGATPEMSDPRLYGVENLPFDQMWPADSVWLPQALDHTLASPLGFIVHYSGDLTLRGVELVEEADDLEIFF